MNDKKPLVSKGTWQDTGFRYGRDFKILASMAHYRAGDQVLANEGNVLHIVRQCHISEFAHLDYMRKLYTELLVAHPPLDPIYWYEVEICDPAAQQAVSVPPSRSTS